ncbi:MAG: hypothetical protein KF799_11045 [Bdellovibrionales bacterium]|nr:hypothetical protein [Bdellovibrionales bacterium]
MKALFFLAVLLPSSYAAAAVTVDQLTCAQAAHQVSREGRYYLSTRDGAIPIYNVASVDSPPSCGTRQILYYHIVQTRDNAQCLVGYSCRGSGGGN